MMRIASFLVFGLAACGSHDHMPDASGPPCDYVEASDGANAVTAEPTALELGTTTRNLCGTIDLGHRDPVTHAIDVDRFRVSVPADADVRVRFAGGSGVETLADFSVLVFDTAANPTLLNGDRLNAALGDHGVFVATLPAGEYDFVVTANAPVDPPAAIDYKVRVLADARAVRCAIAMGAPDYVEAHDGAGDHDNDVLEADPPTYKLTAADDAPEPTSLVVPATAGLHLSGTSANVTGNDRYLDRDTYTFQTGPEIDELAIRLEWGVATADLDYLVFANGSATRVAGSTIAGPRGELAVFPVLPSTSYQLWVGATKGSAGMPATYDVMMCGAHATLDVGR